MNLLSSSKKLEENQDSSLLGKNLALLKQFGRSLGTGIITGFNVIPLSFLTDLFAYELV